MSIIQSVTGPIEPGGDHAGQVVSNRRPRVTLLRSLIGCPIEQLKDHLPLGMELLDLGGRLVREDGEAQPFLGRDPLLGRGAGVFRPGPSDGTLAIAACGL